MIETPTLFILGAGASMPYGYPDARTLFDEVCLGNFDVPPESDHEPPQFAQSRNEDKRAFCQALRGCGLTSVDRFLEYRTDLLPMGVAGIAGRLVTYESENHLFAAGRALDWYRAVFTAMLTSIDRFAGNQVAFATFNYDRSLEHFLSTSLGNLNKGDFKAARAVVAQLKIEHLYGSLGEYFDTGSERYRPYSVDQKAESLRRAAASIRISTHERFENGRFDVLDQLYGWAERVVLLGVGLTGKENLERLALPTFRGDARFIASCMYTEERERRAARDIAQRDVDWAAPGDDCMMTLRKFVL